MPTVMTVRHGPIDPSYSGRFIGTLDFPLSEEGRQAAKLLARRISGCQGSRIYCSPLRRATETAVLLFPGRVDISLRAELRERSLGEWEGVDKGALRERYPQAFLASGRLDPEFTPPAGESLLDVVARIKYFVKEIREHQEPVWVISHSGAILVLRALSANVPFRQIFEASEPMLTPRRIEL